LALAGIRTARESNFDIEGKAKICIEEEAWAVIVVTAPCPILDGRIISISWNPGTAEEFFVVTLIPYLIQYQVYCTV